MLDKHRYLGAPNPVGERFWYAATALDGRWLGVLLFTAASRELRHRDQWIGRSDEQRRCRLPLLVNNSRFLLLPDQSSPNLGSAVLSRVAARLSDDWMERYAHPVDEPTGVRANHRRRTTFPLRRADRPAAPPAHRAQTRNRLPSHQPTSRCAAASAMN